MTSESDVHSNDRATLEQLEEIEHTSKANRHEWNGIPIPEEERKSQVVESHPTDSPWLRTKRAQAYLQMSNSSFWSKIREDPRAPQPHKLGGILLWDKKDLRRWVESK